MSLIKDGLPWLLSALTIYMTVAAGNKARHAWTVGLVNSALWLVWIIATQAWGLLPMNLALWVVYARNYRKWSAALLADGASCASTTDASLTPGNSTK